VSPFAFAMIDPPDVFDDDSAPAQSSAV